MVSSSRGSSTCIGTTPMLHCLTSPTSAEGKRWRKVQRVTSCCRPFHEKIHLSCRRPPHSSACTHNAAGRPAGAGEGTKRISWSWQFNAYWPSHRHRHIAATETSRHRLSVRARISTNRHTAESIFERHRRTE